MGTGKHTKHGAKLSPLPLLKPAGRHAKKPPSKHTPRRIGLKKLLVIYSLAILASGLAAGLLARAASPRSASTSNPFSAAQRKLVQFSLYYPASMPPGYHSDQPAMPSKETAVVTLQLNAGAAGDGTPARGIVLSQQAIPAHFDFQSFLASFAHKQTLRTKYGTATIGLIDNGQTRIASLVTDDGTWILASTKLGVPANDLLYVLGHLAKVPD